MRSWIGLGLDSEGPGRGTPVVKALCLWRGGRSSGAPTAGVRRPGGGSGEEGLASGDPHTGSLAPWVLVPLPEMGTRWEQN